MLLTFALHEFTLRCTYTWIVWSPYVARCLRSFAFVAVCARLARVSVWVFALLLCCTAPLVHTRLAVVLPFTWLLYGFTLYTFTFWFAAFLDRFGCTHTTHMVRYTRASLRAFGCTDCRITGWLVLPLLFTLCHPPAHTFPLLVCTSPHLYGWLPQFRSALTMAPDFATGQFTHGTRLVMPRGWLFLTRICRTFYLCSVLCCA